jgi:hypothetical protein
MRQPRLPFGLERRELPADYTVGMQQAKSGGRAARRPGSWLGMMLLAAVATASVVAPAQAQARQTPTEEDASTPKPDMPTPQSGAKPTGAKANAGEHRFWNRENDWLFAGVGAARTLDYFSTLNMRRRGRQEILLSNDAVDNHAAFATIEAAGTAVSIGAAYLFHRYEHHKLERWTSIVHIGLATTGAVRNYCLKTAHVAPASPP